LKSDAFPAHRGAQLHQTPNGNHWPLATVAHIRIDAVSGLARTVIATAAKVYDSTQTYVLLHNKASEAFSDAGLDGPEKHETNQSKALTTRLTPLQGSAECGRTRKKAGWARIFNNSRLTFA